MNWSTSAMDGSGNIGINWTIQFSDDTNYNVTWTHHTETINWNWDIHYINAGNDVSYSASSNSSINGSAEISDTESRVAWDAGASNSIISSMTTIMKSNSYPTMFGGYSGAKNGVLSGKVPSTISGIGSDTGIRAYNWDTANHTQIYRRDLTAYRQANTYLSIKKITSAGYEDFVANNPNYSLAGTRFEVYSDAPCTNHLGTIDINADGSSNTLTLSAAYANTNVYLKETVAGHGYKLNPAVISVTLNAAGQTTTATLSNSPTYDPAFIKLTKVSSVSGTTNYSGTILAQNAEYTVEQYYNSADALSTSNIGRTWIYSTLTSGFINTADPSKLISGTPYLKPASTIPQFPLGTYRIYESKAPTNASGVETGLELSTHVYYVTLEMNADGLRVDRTIYMDGIDAGHMLSSDIITDGVEASADLAAEETEVWHPIGLLKVDSDKHAALPGYTTATIPQGDATYVGAKFYVYTTDTNIFAATTAGLYQGHTYTIDGLNRICVDGVPLSIVTQKASLQRVHQYTVHVVVG